MELSSEDIKRLKENGYRLEDFTVIDKEGARLRNVNDYCYFYCRTDKKCKIYENRPIGCYIYPVIYITNKGATVDELCPMGQTISEQELRTKRKILYKLLKTIDKESAHYQRVYARQAYSKGFYSGQLKK